MKKLVGRTQGIAQIQTCLELNRNLLIEGPVGVGKTFLVLHVLNQLGKTAFRVDGDARFTEQKLTGWFDPPMVLKSGYGKESFVPGPLYQAMEAGIPLFINELNRLPEGVQNVLLPVLDEGILEIPNLGRIEAKPGFCVIATQNPKEFVATSHLSEALMDRFEWLFLDYQTAAEEKEIVLAAGLKDSSLLDWAVQLVRLSREEASVKRGASVRAAIALVEIGEQLGRASEKNLEECFLEAALMTLSNRIEIENDHDRGEVIRQLVDEVLKKNS